jgi:hypothetical protein
MRAQAPVVCVDSRAVIARLKRLGKGALRALGVPRASALQGEQTIRERTRRKRKGRQAAMRPRILRFRCQAPISRLVDLPQRTSPTPEVWSGKMRRDRMSKTLALLAATAAVVSLSTRADAMRAITANDGMLCAVISAFTPTATTTGHKLGAGSVAVCRPRAAARYRASGISTIRPAVA